MRPPTFSKSPNLQTSGQAPAWEVSEWRNGSVMGSGGWLTHLLRFAQICSDLVNGSHICSDGNEMNLCESTSRVTILCAIVDCREVDHPLVCLCTALDLMSPCAHQNKHVYYKNRPYMLAIWSVPLYLLIPWHRSVPYLTILLK